jgi:hypothetical protein
MSEYIPPAGGLGFNSLNKGSGYSHISPNKFKKKHPS